ncbi:MAG: hypothetical protein IJ808_03395 [Muribaculaceae bacterium]|nr:hypothetical protein [Muribaculaceae bacterium]
MKGKQLAGQYTFFIIFWIGAVFGFISNEWLQPLMGVRSQVMWTLDAAFFVLACCMVRRWQLWIPLLVLLSVSWVVTCLINGLPLLFWLNGVREFIGITLVYPVVCSFCDDEASREHFLRQLNRQLLIFLFIQAFCILYQFLYYGEAGDLGGGSYGWFYSGQVSVSIYLVSFYLLQSRINSNRLFRSLNDNKLLLILLLPTFFNETKISFVMLALYIVLLLPIDRKLLLRLVWGLPLAAALLWGAVQLYVLTTNSHVQGNRFESFEDLAAYFMLEDVEEAEGDAKWNIENSSKGIADVPRLTKVFYLPLLNEQEPGHVLTGFGIGHFKGGTSMATSEFADEYDWLLMGSIPYAFHIYIQLGLMGLALLIVFWLWVFFVPPRRQVQRRLNVQILLAFTVMIMACYIDVFRNLSFCMIFFSLMAASWIDKPAETE